MSCERRLGTNSKLLAIFYSPIETVSRLPQKLTCKKIGALFCVATFLWFAFLLEGNGYIIHKTAYDRGAAWTPDDLNRDLRIKIALYQSIIFLLFAVHRNIWVFFFTELFWFTCTHDLLFFYLTWNGGVFPSGNWTWMPFYFLFGTWTTQMQFALSLASLSLFSVLYLGWKKWQMVRKENLRRDVLHLPLKQKPPPQTQKESA